MSLGMSSLQNSIWSISFGAVNSSAVIDINLSLLQSVLFANCFQLLLSSIYFIYNGMYTFMLSAVEWSRFSHSRKALRVTSPSAEQRSTYWLQLPWTYSIPLSILSGVMHWLVSESVFLAQLEVYDTFYQDGDSPTPTLSDDSFLGCGYSASALIAVIILGSIMVLVLIGNAFRRLDGGIPLVGSCSLAISAACHRPPADKDAAYLPVQWGVVTQPSGCEPGHCCFTSFEVEPPIVGQLYAGYTKVTEVKCYQPEYNEQSDKIIDSPS